MTDPTPQAPDSTQAPDPAHSHVGGGMSEVDLDQANIAMRTMPWYQDLMASWGYTGGHVPTLNSQQQQQVRQQAQAHGFQVDEGDVHIDEHGNFRNTGHKLRNTLIVAGLAAATLATMGAAGVFSGAVAGAMGAGEAAGAGAAGAGAGAGAAGAVGAGTLAGIEGGAAGLTGAGAAGLGAATAVPALGGAASGILPSVLGQGAEAAGGYAQGAGPGMVAGSGMSSSGMGSILGQAGQYGQRLAPILGQAAGANANANQRTFENTANLAEAQLREPATHLSNIRQANTMAAGPVQAHWGGPGSGLRGEVTSYTGGKNAPLSPENQAQMQPFMHGEMDKLLHPMLDPQTNPRLRPGGGTSAWDRILGAGATGASILGGLT